MVFVLDLCCEGVPVGLHFFLLALGHGEDDPAVAWDGIVHLAGVPLRQAQRHLALLRVEESREDLDGVGAFLLDVVA